MGFIFYTFFVFHGHQRSEKVEYLDDYHMKIGSTVQHICEFAERMARSRGIVEPEPLTQQEQRAWNLEYDYYLTVQADNGTWEYALYQGDCCLLERGKIDAPELMIEEVRDEIMYTHNLRNKDCIPLTQEEFDQKLADRNEIQSYRIANGYHKKITHRPPAFCHFSERPHFFP